jgi:transposase
LVDRQSPSGGQRESPLARAAPSVPASFPRLAARPASLAQMPAATAAAAMPARGGQGRAETAGTAARASEGHQPAKTAPAASGMVFLPPCSPELQPAERLWPLVDEPIANRYFASLAELDATIAERCRRLDAATIRPHTDFHWWPKPKKPN